MRLNVLRALLPRGSSEVLYECRHCGTSVGADADVCPICGRAEIAQYRIE